MTRRGLIEKSAERQPMGAYRKADIKDMIRRRTDIKDGNSLEIHRLISRAAKDGIVVMSNDGKGVYFNPAAEKMFGYKADEVVGFQLHDLITPESYREAQAKGLHEFSDTGNGPAIGKTLELVGKKKDGTEFPVELSLVSAPGENGKWLAIGIIHDITERKITQEQLQSSQENLKDLVKHSPVGIVLTDINGMVTVWNESQEIITGIPHEEAVGVPLWKIQLRLAGRESNAEDTLRMTLIFDNLLTSGFVPPQMEEYEVSFTNLNGEFRTIRNRVYIIKEPDGNHLASITTDITEEVRFLEELKNAATRDPLTGLFNRRYLKEELTRLDTKRNLPISIIILDIDLFKNINDTLGHEKGDIVLQEVALAITQACREGEIIVRWGGEEFLIVMGETKPEDLPEIIARIRTECSAIKLCPVSISIGTASKTFPEQKVDDVIREADTRMYQDKDVFRSTGKH